jgi:hypothetical protein
MTRRGEGPVTGSAITVVIPQVRSGSVLLRVEFIIRGCPERGVRYGRSCPEDEWLVAKAGGRQADDTVSGWRWGEVGWGSKMEADGKPVLAVVEVLALVEHVILLCDVSVEVIKRVNDGGEGGRGRWRDGERTTRCQATHRGWGGR